MNRLAIEEYLAVQPMRHGAGFQAHGVRGSDAAMDPFLMVDHYRMSQPTFGPHPHAGFSAVTYMFDDAETGFNNRDSLGNACEIRAGDNYWTVAGRGVLHDEAPVVNGKIAHGLQLFVNLGAGNKHIEPYAIHIAREDMPRFTQASGARVKVAFGGYDDGERAFAPVKPLPTDANLFDIEIPAAQSFHYAIAAGVNAFLLVIKGSVSIGGVTVNAAHAVGFGRRGGALEVNAVEEAHIALFLGVRLNEPVVRHGPFAMTSRADIERAIAAYQSGQMGELR